VHLPDLVASYKLHHIKVAVVSGQNIASGLDEFQARGIVFAGGSMSVLQESIPGLPACAYRCWHV